jgi:hypothetical protein
MIEVLDKVNTSKLLKTNFQTIQSNKKMANTITGKIQVGNTVIISGRYKLDIPQNGMPNDLNYIRTADIVLDQHFKAKPTVVASIHHVDTSEHRTQGNSVPFVISNIDVDLTVYAPKTRIMIMATQVEVIRIAYEYWCDYIVMGEIA